MNEQNLQDKSVPPEFHKNNSEKENRSIRLAELAKKWLIEKQIPATMIEFLHATKVVDIEGKGISQSTLFKNSQVHDIFISICPNKVKTKRKTKKRWSKRTQENELRKSYSDHSKLEIIKLYEALKIEYDSLQKRFHESIMIRNELKRQNENQLVELTQLLLESTKN